MISVSRQLLLLMVVASVTGCTVGPTYKRPVVDVPAAYRGGDERPGAGSQQTATASLGDEPWADVFDDEQLKTLIRTALARNYDARVAAARVLEARASFGITRADQFPEVDAQGQAQEQHGIVAGGVRLPTSRSLMLGASTSWEPDFWGRYRRATESTRAQILATEWGRRAVLTSLVAQVATAYYTMGALDLQLEIARRTLGNRQEALNLTNALEQGGANSLLDVRQAEQLVYAASAAIVDFQRQIEQQENQIRVLLGQYPATVSRGRVLTDQPHPPALPAGVPATLLERRADIRQAEAAVVAANANIGVAKAAYFPRIPLTGTGGVASAALGSLFTSGMWSVAAGIAQPVLTAGRTKSRVGLARAQTEEAVLRYEQTVQQAFRDVSDGLVGYRRAGELRRVQEELVHAAEDTRRLTEIRYRAGVSSFLEVLDSDTRLFSAQLTLVQAQLNELTTFVSLYRALGGGWKQ
jgi:multidrug efflux system outer membrane protein